LSWARPRQNTKNAFSCVFLPRSHQEPLFPSQHMHREAQRIYTLINIYSSRSIEDMIFKVGSARFINMHINQSASKLYCDVYRFSKSVEREPGVG
jgi:hypothetical protein